MPCINADCNFCLIAKSFSAVLDVLANNAPIGNTSDIPIAPPINSDTVSAIGPTSSPISLAICTLSACCATPVGTAKDKGNVNSGDLKYCLLNNLAGCVANALPARPAPRKGTKEPIPSLNLVVHKS